MKRSVYTCNGDGSEFECNILIMFDYGVLNVDSFSQFLQNIISWVPVGMTRHTQIFEELHDTIGGTVVRNSSVTEKQEFIKHVEKMTRWLVNGCDDSTILLHR